MGSRSDIHACTSSQSGHNFVDKEYCSSKGVHDQPCESTGLTERHARMTKTKQIGHLKGKTTNPSDSISDNLCANQKPAFMVIVELDRKQNGKEKKKHGFHVLVDKRPT